MGRLEGWKDGRIEDSFASLIIRRRASPRMAQLGLIARAQPVLVRIEVHDQPGRDSHNANRHFFRGLSRFPKNNSSRHKKHPNRRRILFPNFSASSENDDEHLVADFGVSFMLSRSNASPRCAFVVNSSPCLRFRCRRLLAKT